MAMKAYVNDYTTTTIITRMAVCADSGALLIRQVRRDLAPVADFFFTLGAVYAAKVTAGVLFKVLKKLALRARRINAITAKKGEFAVVVGSTSDPLSQAFVLELERLGFKVITVDFCICGNCAEDCNESDSYQDQPVNFPNAMIVQNGVLRGDQRQRLRGIGAKVLVLNGSKIIDPSHTDERQQLRLEAALALFTGVTLETLVHLSQRQSVIGVLDRRRQSFLLEHTQALLNYLEKSNLFNVLVLDQVVPCAHSYSGSWWRPGSGEMALAALRSLGRTDRTTGCWLGAFLLWVMPQWIFPLVSSSS